MLIETDSNYDSLVGFYLHYLDRYQCRMLDCCQDEFKKFKFLRQRYHGFMKTLFGNILQSLSWVLIYLKFWQRMSVHFMNPPKADLEHHVKKENSKMLKIAHFLASHDPDKLTLSFSLRKAICL